MPCDAVTLGEWFERHGEIATIGGVAYLAELANNTPSAANVKAYAGIVREKSVLRKLIEVGTQRQFRLLEALAAEMVQTVFAEFPLVQEVELRVQKMCPPMNAIVASVGVQITRRRIRRT